MVMREGKSCCYRQQCTKIHHIVIVELLLVMIQSPITCYAQFPEFLDDLIFIIRLHVVQLLLHAIAKGLFSLFTEQYLMKV